MSEYQPIQWTKYTTKPGDSAVVQLAHVCDMMPALDGGTLLSLVNGHMIVAREPMNYFLTGRLPAIDPKLTAERLG